ncbi:putative ring-cleaving dioxygenase MhqO [compost metagenome]
MNRQYFKAVYFREGGGILFEIATDPPGFATDEPEESLGEELMLPDWYESERSTIESLLPPFEIRSLE